ncbi:MAG: hypothetical protein VX420_03315 [SAR324 cluster bacterium]|nr:hypothetical protein [SAR324 cluster bacterium]
MARKTATPLLGPLLLLITLTFLIPSSAWALKVKLRIDLPLGGSYSITGLNSFVPYGGFGLGLGVVIPYEQDIDIETGYEYKSRSFTDSTSTYEGKYTSHFVQIGASYSGIGITDSYKLIFSGTVDLPLAGSAEVTRRSDGSKTSSSSFGGLGFYGTAGVADGRVDYYTFYMQRSVSYGLTPPGENAKLKWTTAAYGLGVGYTF